MTEESPAAQTAREGVLSTRLLSIVCTGVTVMSWFIPMEEGGGRAAPGPHPRS